MLTFHRLRRTWLDDVDLYVVPSDFSRQKFVEAGLPGDRVVVKPNFVEPDPGVRAGNGHFALYVGRLVPEKGVMTLLDAWRRIQDLPLRIVGDGPLREQLAAVAASINGGRSIEFLGTLSNEEVRRLLRQARLLVFPSECYETFGRVTIEAFAVGVPVVSARIGAVAEVVTHGITGLHFIPGDPADLAAAVQRIASDTDLSTRNRACRAAAIRKRLSP